MNTEVTPTPSLPSEPNGTASGLAFAEEYRDTGRETLRFGIGGGPTAHLLIEGFFQLDFFLNFAALSNGRFSTGLLVWLNKVF